MKHNDRFWYRVLFYIALVVVAILFAREVKSESMVIYNGPDTAWAAMVPDSVALGYHEQPDSNTQFLSLPSNPGDFNLNGETNSADIIYLVNYVLKAGKAPPPNLVLQSWLKETPAGWVSVTTVTNLVK